MLSNLYIKKKQEVSLNIVIEMKILNVDLSKQTFFYSSFLQIFLYMSCTFSAKTCQVHILNSTDQVSAAEEQASTPSSLHAGLKQPQQRQPPTSSEACGDRQLQQDIEDKVTEETRLLFRDRVRIRISQPSTDIGELPLDRTKTQKFAKG